MSSFTQYDFDNNDYQTKAHNGGISEVPWLKMIAPFLPSLNNIYYEWLAIWGGKHTGRFFMNIACGETMYYGFFDTKEEAYQELVEAYQENSDEYFYDRIDYLLDTQTNELLLLTGCLNGQVSYEIISRANTSL